MATVPTVDGSAPAYADPEESVVFDLTTSDDDPISDYEDAASFSEALEKVHKRVRYESDVHTGVALQLKRRLNEVVELQRRRISRVSATAKAIAKRQEDLERQHRELHGSVAQQVRALFDAETKRREEESARHQSEFAAVRAEIAAMVAERDRRRDDLKRQADQVRQELAMVHERRVAAKVAGVPFNHAAYAVQVAVLVGRLSALETQLASSRQ